MKKGIVPCLWFDGDAKEAVDFYTSIFKDHQIISANEVVIIFKLNGSKFMALNGGPHFKFNEAVSFVIECETQTEIDWYWDHLIANGGAEGNCGWLKDQYGVSWQVVPSILSKLMRDPLKSKNVMEAFMKMKKFNIQELLDA